MAGLVAGVVSMAPGEYVSVSSKADTEIVDPDRERKRLATEGDFEIWELAGIYVERGLEESLARQVDGPRCVRRAMNWASPKR